MVASVETWVRKHLNDICLPQVIVSSNYDVSSRKFFLTETCSSSTSRRLSELTIFSCPSDLLIAMQSTTDCDDYVTIYMLTSLSESVFFFIQQYDSHVEAHLLQSVTSACPSRTQSVSRKFLPVDLPKF